jgi:hypothetical protein
MKDLRTAQYILHPTHATFALFFRVIVTS